MKTTHLLACQPAERASPRRQITLVSGLSLIGLVIPLTAAAQQTSPQPARQPFVLVTDAEAAASQAAGGLLVPRSTPAPGAPRIELVAPDLSQPVTAPTNIQVRFTTSAPAEPKPETFRVLYGAFRVDVTQRLLGVAKVTKEGIQVRDAVLPSGRHQLALVLTDTLGREVQQVVAFTVR
jgi:hypothetical protein